MDVLSRLCNDIAMIVHRMLHTDLYGQVIAQYHKQYVSVGYDDSSMVYAGCVLVNWRELDKLSYRGACVYNYIKHMYVAVLPANYGNGSD